MPVIVRLLLFALVLVPIGSAEAAPTCTPGTTGSCTTVGGCVGTRYCSGDPEDPRSGEWSECVATFAAQACSTCGTGGAARCLENGEDLGPCQPPTAQAQDFCNNNCDDDRDGAVDEGCAGGNTFDYCELQNGVYTRWTCGCGEGLNVGYCLGSSDSQASCSGASGCLKAPAFGTSGASQSGGNFRCCVSSLPCSTSGYIQSAFHCGTGLSQRYECMPNTSCADSNQCGDGCRGLPPSIDRTLGSISGHGTSCQPGDSTHACTAAQGGLSSELIANGGVSAAEDGQPPAEFEEWMYVTAPPPIPGYTLLWPRGGGGHTSPREGGGAGGGSGSGREGAPAPRPQPEPNQCSASGGGVIGSALSMMSSPKVSLSDLTTRYAAVDVGIQGSLGGLNFVRKYVSTDKTWAYLSMLSNSSGHFLPSPFGSSPTSRDSIRWWHSFYSFVFPRGMVPGVSTWAVRDTDGAILEYVACDAGSTGCFATPRKTTRWTTAQLFWTGGSPGSFILVKPGVGRFVYAATWQPAQSPIPTRYFLSQVQDELLSGGGVPRTRLTLQYAAPALGYNCPGLSATGNGVPYLDKLISEDGATLKLYYRFVASYHSQTNGPPGHECVLDRIALRNNPNSGSVSETVVAQYQYAPRYVSDPAPYAGLLESVTYPETGDVVSYTGNVSASWVVNTNGMQMGSHTYTDGKVSSVSMASGLALSIGSASGSCSLAQVMSSTECPPEVTPTQASAGDSAGTLLSMRRTFSAVLLEYLPFMKVNAYTDTCVSGNCSGFAMGRVANVFTDQPQGFLHFDYVKNKSQSMTYHTPVLATAATASSSIPSPIAQETTVYGATSLSGPGVYFERTEYAYGNFSPGAPPEPFKPVVTSRDVRPSVLVIGQDAVVTSSYDSLTHRLKSTLVEGYTEQFAPQTGTWSTPMRAYVATFYFNHHKCLGQVDTGDARILEVHGPCAVSGPAATDCDLGNDFPITQYHYYGPPSVEASNRANRLQKVSRILAHSGPSSCTGAPALEVTFNDYNMRGTATLITDAQGVQTSFQYAGDRLQSSTAAGQTTTFSYDGAQLTAAHVPAGNHSVYCYRSGTTPGAGCTGGTRTTQLQWKATAADAQGVNWSEAILYTYWPSGALKKAEYRSNGSGGAETRRVLEFHPDAHGRPTYSRVGEGPGSFAVVNGFDVNGNMMAVGLPFNAPPDFCKDTQTQSLSEVCKILGYDAGDRPTSVTEHPASDVSQTTLLGRDAQGHVSTVRHGCVDPMNCQTPTESYQFDDFGNPIRVQLPHPQGPVRSAYDALGKLVVRQTEAMRQAGEWVEYTYDLASRLRAATRVSPASTPSRETLFRLGYDAEETLPSDCNRYPGEIVDLHSWGRLRFHEDSFGRTWYRYDLAGRLMGEMRQRQGESSCNRVLETQYQYDTAGRLTQVVYPYGRTVSYVYGTGAQAGRISGIDVTLFTDTGPEVRSLLTNIVWEPFGGVRGYQLNPPSGMARAVEYAAGDDGSIAPAGCTAGFPSASSSDRTGRLRSLRVSSGSFTPGTGAGDIYKRTYTWRADQVVRVDTCLLGATTPRTELYDYDRTLRLTTASRPSGNYDATGGAFSSLNFTYDRRGNRTAIQEWGVAPSTLAYGTGSSVDRLQSVTNPRDTLQTVAFFHDADGRVIRKESGEYLSGQPAHVLDLRYSPNGSEGQGSAREAVMRTVSVNGATYTYYYDALGRRRAKVSPFNIRDEFFYGNGSMLLVDQGSDGILSTSFRPVDDYVWLSGRPVVLLRGKLAASADTRLPDTSADCQRNGEPAACGAYFPVTDHIGRPALMLDSEGLVAGAADYEPFGHVNRVTLREATAHPYPDDEEESFTAFVQPPENGQVKVRMRGIYQLMDMEEGEDFIKLVDMDTGQVLSQKTGVEVGRQVTGWVQPSNGGVHVNLVSGPMGTEPNAYTGAVVEGYEYQRYQTGAQPFWTPLRFPGHYYDAETDLFENWNRYYDPSIGRYLQPEPLLAEGPFALPTYSYAMNNPLGFVDPSGGAPLPAWLWVRSTTKMGLGIVAWANGMGPHVVTFGPDSAEVQAMRLSDSFESVRRAFYTARSQGNLGNFNQLSAPGCTELFGNPFGFSIGKYDAYFRPNADGKTVSIVLYNRWSISSLGHGNFDGPDELPSYEAFPWIPSPMSNVHQFFFWTETLP